MVFVEVGCDFHFENMAIAFSEIYDGHESVDLKLFLGIDTISAGSNSVISVAHHSYSTVGGAYQT